MSLGVLVGLAAAAGEALAQRPALAGEATYGVTGGSVLVHYATTGADAAPTRDDNMDGVSDFVAEVASTAEDALSRLTAMGFRRPLGDGAEGGDGRIDFYLRNLMNADGSAGVDSCTGGAGGQCVGYAIAENDFAGFSYPTVTEGIRSVVPHELFHLIQMAYASGQTAAWSEGSAVWAVEELYGDANSDMERFLPSFLPRNARPLERTGGGLGDNYPYGAALWPYFLAKRFDAKVILDAWAVSSEAKPFLDAIDSVLATRGSSVLAAFAEMTRWNLFTGARAAGGRYPSSASSWPMVTKEPPISGDGMIYVEGLSARYLDVTISGERHELRVLPTDGIKVVGWAVPAGGGYGEGVALDPISGKNGVAKVLDPGTYTLVVTGQSRATILTAVNLELAPVPAEIPDDEEGSDGGCQAASSSSGAMSALLGVGLLLGWRRRRGAAAKR